MDKSLLRYSMLIEWSEEDQAYLVTLPEWADRVMMPATRQAEAEEAPDSIFYGEALPTPKIHAA